MRVVPSDPGFDHSGGLQLVGHYLVMGLEHGDRSRVAFWDVSTPESPRRVGTLEHATGLRGAGTVSLAKLAGGHHLLLVGGTNANALDVYVSRAGSTLAQPAFDWVTRWNEGSLTTELPDGDREFGNYQNLSLVADAGGGLYLIGTHKNTAIHLGHDWADLFRVESSGGALGLVKVAKRRLRCAEDGQPAQCNLDAGGGVFVTSGGRLLLYGTEHRSDGPAGSVKLRELRTAPHADACPAVEGAWVELHEDSRFRGRSVMLDYVDRSRREEANYDRLEDFEDRASSARWCLPPGWRFRMHEDKGPCGGRAVDLVGTGVPEEDPDFDDRSGAVQRFGDEVSCSRWVGP